MAARRAPSAPKDPWPFTGHRSVAEVMATEGPVRTEVPVALLREALALLGDYRRDWPADITVERVERTLGAEEAALFRRVDTAIYGLATVLVVSAP